MNDKIGDNKFIAQDLKTRLDKFLSEQLKNTSRSQIQRDIEAGKVLVNGKNVNESKFVVRKGDQVKYDYSDNNNHNTGIQPSNTPLKILYDNHGLLIIDKPAGLTVHPGAGFKGETLASALLYHFSARGGNDIKLVGEEGRPGIVHRLDKDTSGVILVAKTQEMYEYLKDAFAERKVKKEYIALVSGRVEKPMGKIDLPIGKSRTDFRKMDVKNVIEPKQALTEYKVLEYLESNSNNLEFSNCIIVHGSPKDEASWRPPTDKNKWMSWIKEELEKVGIKTYTPSMPTPWLPLYKAWKEEFEKTPINKNSILIGHSAGGAFLVRWLSETGQKIKKMILVAPGKILHGAPTEHSRNKELYDFEINPTIKKQVQEIVVITSDNDKPWRIESANLYKKKLSAKLIIIPGKAHFTYKEMGTRELPELLEEILKHQVKKDKVDIHTLILVKLHTGRTHQIRVHLKALGHPLMGDSLYGGKKTKLEGLQRQFLHARKIEVRLPNNTWIEAESELPRDLTDVLYSLNSKIVKQL